MTLMPNKTLDRFRKGGRKWNEAIDERLKNSGLIPTCSEPYLYHGRSNDDCIIVCR